MKKLFLQLLIFIFIAGCSKSDLNVQNLEQQIINLNETVDNLRIEIGILKTENASLKESIPEKIEGKCTFIRTFRIIDKLNYQATVPEYKFIILDQFQLHEPFILKISTIFYNKLEKNKNYEFTLSGEKKFNKINGHYTSEKNLFDYFKIDDIKITNKLGLEQTQNPCE